MVSVGVDVAVRGVDVGDADADGVAVGVDVRGTGLFEGVNAWVGVDVADDVGRAAVGDSVGDGSSGVSVGVFVWVGTVSVFVALNVMVGECVLLGVGVNVGVLERVELGGASIVSSEDSVATPMTTCGPVLLVAIGGFTSAREGVGNMECIVAPTVGVTLSQSGSRMLTSAVSVAFAWVGATVGVPRMRRGSMPESVSSSLSTGSSIGCVATNGSTVTRNSCSTVGRGTSQRSMLVRTSWMISTSKSPAIPSRKS